MINSIKKDIEFYNSDIIPKKRQSAFHSGIQQALFNACKHLFSLPERNLIEGNLRRGNLAICQSALVSEKLSKARQDGQMTVQDFTSLYQFYSFSKKIPFAGNDQLCREAGLSKFLKGEGKCKVTNMTFESRRESNFALFDRVSLIIQDILGPVPCTILTKPDISFGPGSSVNPEGRPYSRTSLFFKQTDRLYVPEKAKVYLAAHLSSHPNWVDNLGTHYRIQKAEDESRLSFEMRVFEKHLVIVKDFFPNRISFVPKTSEEHRTIGIELNGQVPLQKVLGDFIRRKLNVVGIDLNSQDRNRH
jgi:hypothetical protein